MVGARRRARACGSLTGLTTLALIHEEDAGPGVFADVATELEPRSFALGTPPEHPPGHYDAVIVLGGGMHVDQEAEHPWLTSEKAFIAELLERRVPTLGVCLGAQLVAEVAGAAVGPLPGGAEIGWHEVSIDAPDPLLGDAPRLRAFEWHSYGFQTPPGATELARNGAGSQAFRLNDAWGIQFHAEVTAEIVAGWVRDYGPEAGVDAEALRVETAAEIARWNAFGRELCSRFVALAS
jgi:GMP synthase-like glutamine amidotransferase